MEDALLSQRQEALKAPTPEEAAMREGLRAVTAEILGELGDREAQVIRMRFGIGTGRADEMTLHDVATALNISPERARQIESKALRKLRHPSRSARIGRWLENEDYQTYLDHLERRIRWVKALRVARKERALSKNGWKERWRNKVKRIDA